MNVELPFSAEI